MKKSIILLAVLSASLVSCSKTEESRLEVKSGIPMSISASFSDLTKTSTVADGNVLKSTWDAEESISIITLDALSKGKVVAIDNFTSRGAAGRSSAKFTGTFTGGVNPVKVIAVYPALEKDGDTYRTKENYAWDHSTDYPSSILKNIRIGSDNVDTKPEYLFCQDGSGSCNHLKDFCVMVGKVDTERIKRGELSVSLRHLMMVFKIQVTFLDSHKGQHLENIQILAYNNAGTSQHQFMRHSFSYVDLDSSPSLGAKNFYLDNTLRMPTSLNVPESGVVTLYVPCAPYDRLKVESKWRIVARFPGRDSGSSDMISNKEVVYEAGKMYRINVSMSY